jgi:hypothetical protein
LFSADCRESAAVNIRRHAKSKVIGVGSGQTAEFRLSLRNNRGYGSTTGAVYIDNIQLEGAVVPEPMTLSMLGIGAAIVFARRARR